MATYYRLIAAFLLGIIFSALNGTQALSDNYTVEVVEKSPKSVIGESPFWCEETQNLYYVDLLGTESQILRYCPADKRVYSAMVEGGPFATFVIPVKGTKDQFVVGGKHSVGVVQWDGKSSKAEWIRTVFEAENCTEFETNLFNDAKADPKCRLFVGTRRNQICSNLDTDPTYANLFRISAKEPPVTLNKPRTIQVSNGMAWNEKLNKYYHVSSCDYSLNEYDYCPHTGDICEFPFT